MEQPSPIAIASFILNIVLMKTLVLKRIMTTAELKDLIDGSLLQFEESGLAAGEQGKAVHANLEMVLSIVSAEPGQKPS